MGLESKAEEILEFFKSAISKKYPENNSDKKQSQAYGNLILGIGMTISVNDN